MGDKSRIEWCDATWNPVTGCTPVSPACDHCYAKRMYERFAIPCRDGPFSKIKFHPSRLDIPLRWKKPRRVFVCSMGDLFHEDVKEECIDKIFGTMILRPQHTFMILTKRPERMKQYMNGGNYDRRTGPPSHIWLGVTVENQEMADRRIPILLQTPAAKRFVSVEPMLGPVDLSPWFMRLKTSGPGWKLTGGIALDIADKVLNLVIAGCESGPGRRPMDMNWVRSLRDQCVAGDIPFFLKQAVINGKLVKMPPLDGKVWDEVPR